MVSLLFFIVTFLGSLLTFFSGFGLGTILLPLFLLVFPIEIAISAAALVHFSNSLFKFTKTHKNIHSKSLVHFGIPAIISSFFGAFLLNQINKLAVLYSYQFNSQIFEVSYMNFTIALLILIFTFIETNKKFKQIEFNQNKLILGGILSGFFGGISGHQGALRSMFLKNLNISKEQLVATTIVISLGVDGIRILVYFNTILYLKDLSHDAAFLILIAILGALFGVLTGNKLLKKISFDLLTKTISICLVVFSILLLLGVI
jgi:uncharacterized membrane protein YfcA